MLPKVKNKWQSIRTSRKAIAILFVQIWLWPQVLSNSLDPGIMFSMIITAAAMFGYNLYVMIDSLEKGL